MAKIISWNPERGFGFADVDGQRVFVHISTVEPRPDRGADLTGVTVEVSRVVRGDKGLKAENVRLMPQVSWALEAGRGVAIRTSALGKDVKRGEYDWWGVLTSTRDAPAEILSWARAQKEDFERAEAARQAELSRLLPDLVEQVRPQLPLGHGEKLQVDEVSIGSTYTEIAAVVVDPVKGATISYCQNLEFVDPQRTRVSQLVEGTKFVGWEGMHLSDPVYNHLDLASGMLVVRMVYGLGGNEKVSFPAVAHAPRLEGGSVKQKISAVTPVGEAWADLLLYENPRTGSTMEPGPWGEYEIASLVAQLDNQALTSAGISEQMPVVTVEVTNFGLHYHWVGFEGESNDGMRAATSWNEDGWATKGGVVITVLPADSNAPSLVKHLVQVEGLDRAAVEKVVRKEVASALKEAHLARGLGEAFGEKLIAQVMSLVPQFTEKAGLWLIDAEEQVACQFLGGTVHGWTVVEIPPVVCGRLSHRTFPQSRLIPVISVEDAQRMGAPGRVVADSVVVYWPEGQQDDHGRVVTEMIRRRDRPYPVGTRVQAEVKTLGQKPSWGGSLVWWQYQISVDIPFDVIRVTTRMEGGKEMRKEEVVGEKMVPETYSPDYVRASSDQSAELNGQFTVKVIELGGRRKGQWAWEIQA